jgi:hypothetical protein
MCHRRIISPRSRVEAASVLGSREGRTLLLKTRFHHIRAPVAARRPGASPKIVQSASVATLKRPKCKRTIQRRLSAGMRRSSAPGKQRQIPEIPQVRTIREHQKPAALCRSQLMRAKRALGLIVRLRRQFFFPGHQRTAPEQASNVTRHAPRPFRIRPVSPVRRLSCRSVSHPKT